MSMCCKRNLEITPRFIPTNIYDNFNTRESIYDNGNSNLFTLVTNPCKFKTKKTEWFLDSERNS